jgi:signal transduction histidine kinase
VSDHDRVTPAQASSETVALGRRPPRDILARLLTGTALIVSALTVALHIANADAPVQTWWLGFVVVGAGLGAMGGLLATRVPDNPIGWIFLAGGLSQGLAGFGREWAVLGYVTHPGSLPGPDWGGWLGWASTISFATLPLSILRFPDGRLTGRFWLWVQRTIVAATLTSIATSMLVAGDYTQEMPGLGNPIGVGWSWLSPVETAAWMVLSMCTLLAAISLIRRWRGAPPALRTSLRWVTIAGVALSVETAVENTPLAELAVFDWLGPVAFLAFVGTVTFSVLRYRLWDIDLLVDLSLVYGILAVLVAVAFVLLVAMTGKVFDGRDVMWPTLVTTGVVTLVFVPLRNRIAEVVDRVRHGARSDPYRALAMVTRRGDPADPTAQLQEAVDLVASESPFLDYVAVTTVDGLTAQTGAPRNEVVTLPLDHQGGRVGTMSIAYRPGSSATRPGAPLGGLGADLLPDLRSRMAEVVAAVGVNQAVAESRRAVAMAREEERRRLRRDLHDGLGPALAAIAMRADSAQLLIDHDPGRAADMLAGLGDEVRTTIADVRRLVYDLQPPVLDAVGLVAAIGEQAAAFSGPARYGIDLAVELTAPQDLPALPAAVEIAAYRIACEALANVVRHSSARRCAITVADDDGTLRLTVDDDGVGHDRAARPGVGTASMIERATELGGALRIGGSPMGGTRVLATLPLNSQRRPTRPWNAGVVDPRPEPAPGRPSEDRP